jgi:hypothetical protein
MKLNQPSAEPGQRLGRLDTVGKALLNTPCLNPQFASEF